MITEATNSDFILLYKNTSTQFTSFNRWLSKYSRSRISVLKKTSKAVSSFPIFEDLEEKISNPSDIENIIKNGEYNSNIAEHFEITVRLGNFSLIKKEMFNSKYCLVKRMLRKSWKDPKNFIYFKRGLKLALISKDKINRYDSFESYFKYYTDIEDEKLKKEFKDIIINQITEYIYSEDLDVLKIIAKLSANYLDDSYNDIFSNIKDNLNQSFVLDRFNSLDFENISNMIIICNNTMEIIEENCSEQSIESYFNWIFMKIENDFDFTLAFHLARRCERFRTLLNSKIEEGELNYQLGRNYLYFIEYYSPAKLFSMLEYHKKIVEIISKYSMFHKYMRSFIFNSLLEKYDLKCLQKLYPYLTYIYTDTELHDIIFYGDDFKNANTEEIKYLYNSWPILEKL